MDKLIGEHEKKKLQVKELVDKRIQLLDKIRELWDRIGMRQGVYVDFDMHLPFVEQGQTAQTG